MPVLEGLAADRGEGAAQFDGLGQRPPDLRDRLRRAQTPYRISCRSIATAAPRASWRGAGIYGSPRLSPDGRRLVLHHAAGRQHRRLGLRSRARRGHPPHLRRWLRRRPGVVARRQARRLRIGPGRSDQDLPQAGRRLGRGRARRGLRRGGTPLLPELVVAGRQRHRSDSPSSGDIWMRAGGRRERARALPGDGGAGDRARRSRPTGAGSPTSPRSREARRSTCSPIPSARGSGRSRTAPGGDPAGRERDGAPLPHRPGGHAW